MHNDIQVLRQILQSAKTIAVVGLSAQWNRPSFFAAKYMQEHGYKIIPVNPRYAGDGKTPAEKIMGETCYASLLDIPHPVDIVDIFRRTDEVLPIAHEALQIGAGCLWQQLGVENSEASQVFLSAGRQSVRTVA